MTACHCDDVRSVLAATNAIAFAGTTEAAPSIDPGPAAPALPQPAVTIATAAAVTAAAVIKRNISLLRRLAPHQPRDQLGEALPREYRADSLGNGQFHIKPA